MGPVGAPVALCQVNRDELKQLFVAPEARGAWGCGKDDRGCRGSSGSRAGLAGVFGRK